MNSNFYNFKKFNLDKAIVQNSGCDKPIFIHSLWRSSSTYFLEKFRNLNDYMTFCEPFHELLNIVRYENIESIFHNEDAERKKLNHPINSINYFSNYKCLLSKDSKRKGVKNHNCKYVLSNYFDSKFNRQQNKYIFSITNYVSSKLQKKPVLGFTRSLGRLEGLRSGIQANHIVLIRDPFSQFFSGLLQKQRHSNNYFLIQYIYILSLSYHLPYVAIFCKQHGIPRLKVNTYAEFVKGYKYLENLFSNSLETQIKSFSLVYLLSYAHSMHLADSTVLIDLLSCSSMYKIQTTALLQKKIKALIDFSDCFCPFYINNLRSKFEAVFAEIYSWLLNNDGLKAKLDSVWSTVDFLNYTVKRKHKFLG